MANGPLRLGSSGKMVRLLDVAMVLWTAGWIVLAVAIGRQVQHLTQLSDTVTRAGAAVRDTGTALRTLENVPFVGQRIGELATRIDEAARSAVASGRDSRESVQRLSVLLTVAIAISPTIPVLALYMPFRISRARDVRAVRQAARRAWDDPAFQEFLARRAVENLPYHRLREITPNPWRDLEQGRFEPLAEAELRRLGLRRVGRE